MARKQEIIDDIKKGFAKLNLNLNDISENPFIDDYPIFKLKNESEIKNLSSEEISIKFKDCAVIHINNISKLNTNS